jgi:hypothetical protein
MTTKAKSIAVAAVLGWLASGGLAYGHYYQQNCGSVGCSRSEETKSKQVFVVGPFYWVAIAGKAVFS